MSGPIITLEERFQLTVSVHLVLIKEGKILLLRRRQTGYDDGCYGLVSGCIDGDESATEAMVRESKEEAGITIRPESLSCRCVMHCHRKSPDWEGMCLFFTANEWEGEICNGEPEKCDDINFFPLEDLPESTIGYVKAGIEHCLVGEGVFTEFGWSHSAPGSSIPS